MLGLIGTTLNLEVEATDGTVWDIHGGADLSSLTDTGTDYTGTGTTETIGVTVPAVGDRYFVRFVSQ